MEVNFEFLSLCICNSCFSASHAPYKWDYWPHDDVRAECRFVGLTNLGATCYLASTIQQLYMIPEARQAIFTAKVWLGSYIPYLDCVRSLNVISMQRLIKYRFMTYCLQINISSTLLFTFWLDSFADV